jgi:sugar/nucleoside kinase (ribokinase family)
MSGIARRSSFRPVDAVARRVPRPSLVALGDLVLDVTATLREPLGPGTDAAASVRFHQGGSAANTARMAARLGGRASFVGAVGRDPWGSSLVRSLRDAGVAVHAPRVAGLTGRIVVLVGPDGERTFATERGAADGLLPDHLQAAWFHRDALHLPGYSLFNVPLRHAAFVACQHARAAGAVVSVDLSSRRPLLARGRQAALRDLRTVAPDVLFANAEEAAALTGGWRRETLLEVAPVVALKQGRSGCLVLVRRGPDVIALAVAARSVEAPDTTGAGDAFNAGFLLSWLAAPLEARRDPRVLRTAALAGHRAARRHLAGARPELEP